MLHHYLGPHRFIDPHRDKLAARGIHFPPIFETLKGYHNPIAQKRKVPLLTAEDLLGHLEKMVDVLSLPWFLNSSFSMFRSNVNSLAECFKKYHTFLVSQQERTIC